MNVPESGERVGDSLDRGWIFRERQILLGARASFISCKPWPEIPKVLTDILRGLVHNRPSRRRIHTVEGEVFSPGFDLSVAIWVLRK